MSLGAFRSSFLLLVFFTILSAGQTVAAPSVDLFEQIKRDSTHLKKDSTHQTFIQRAKAYDQLDMIDIVKLVLNKKLMATSDTVTKQQKLHFGILGAPGYTQSTGFVGVISGNVAFYVKDKHNLNQSSISFETSYTQYNQAQFIISPNIWTKDDKWNIIGDNRIIKYPQPTFGLGGHTLPSDGYTLDYFLLRGHETGLRHVVKDLYVGLGYDFDYHFGIHQLTKDTTTDYDKYGGGTRSISSGPKVEIEYDNRRNSINPTGDFFGSVIFGYMLKYLGSDFNYASLKVDLRTYIHLSKNRKHILTFWSYDQFTFNGHPPYLDLPATGMDDNFNTDRGYVQARFRGKNWLNFEGEYRFPILKDGLFGGVVFANVESFSDYPSNKFTTAAPAWGLGFRVKLNKHSGTNVCVDYAWGLHGSNGLNVNIGEMW